MIKVTIKLEDFMDGNEESYFQTETTTSIPNNRLDEVLLAVHRTLLGHTFTEGLVNDYLNFSPMTCTIEKIGE